MKFKLQDRLKVHVATVQKHADALYELAEQHKMALWHAHEIVKSLNAVMYVAQKFDETDSQ